MARVQYFKDVGVAAEDIPLLIQRSPAILTFSIENQIQPRLEFLRDLGISDENVVKMLTLHPQMLHYSFDNLEEKLNFLGDIGMNDSEAALTVTRLSQFFSLSVEDSLRPKYKYLTDKLGGEGHVRQVPRVFLALLGSTHSAETHVLRTVRSRS